MFNKKGQSALSEHTMVFFIVIAALVAMTTFVRRAFQARLHDARNFMIDTASNACDADCQKAAGLPGNQIAYEYEPYYLQTISDVRRGEAEKTAATNSLVNWSIGARYFHAVNETTNTYSISIQLPPGCADGASPRPPGC